MSNSDIKNNWTIAELQTIYDMPFNDLLWKSHQLHRKYHDPNKIQISTLMSIKTGGCPEDCKYCYQSIRYDTDIDVFEGYMAGDWKRFALSNMYDADRDTGIE